MNTTRSVTHVFILIISPHSTHASRLQVGLGLSSSSRRTSTAKSSDTRLVCLVACEWLVGRWYPTERIRTEHIHPHAIGMLVASLHGSSWTISKRVCRQGSSVWSGLVWSGLVWSGLSCLFKLIMTHVNTDRQTSCKRTCTHLCQVTHPPTHPTSSPTQIVRLTPPTRSHRSFPPYSIFWSRTD